MLKISFKLIVFSICVLAHFQGFSQKKSLSLEDAVLKQYSSFYPKHLNQLQWLPGSELYAFVAMEGSDQVIKIFEAETGKNVQSVAFSEIKEWFEDGQTPAFLPPIKWLNSNTFYVNWGSTYYHIELDKKKVERRFDLPNDASEISFNNNFTACLYNQNDNLMFQISGSKPLQITHDGGNGIVYGTAVHRSEFGIQHGIFWSPDNQKVAFYRMDESMVTDYPLVNTAEIPAKLEPIKYPMAGSKSHHVTLGVYDSKNESSLYLETGEPAEQYLTSVTWSPDGTAIFMGLLNRDQTHLKLNKYSSSSGALQKTLFEEKHDKYVEPENALWFLPHDNTQFIWFSERTGFDHLYLYNIDGELQKTLTNGNWEVESIVGFDQSHSNLMVRGTGEPTRTFNSYDDTYNATQRFIYSIDLKLGGTKILDKTTGTHDAKLSDGGKYLISTFTSIETPHIATITDTRGKLIRTLIKSEDPLEEYAISKPEIIRLSGAGNGHDLYARIIKPSDFAHNKQYPVLIYVYGGPHAQLVRDVYLGAAPLWMYWMAEQGYIIATVDNRGSANRGLEFEQSTFRNLGTVEIADQKAFVEYLTSLEYVDASRMAIHGWSYGGFMTMNMMLLFPGMFQAGVAGGPVCDWSMYEIMYTERYMDTPASNPEGYERANLIKRANKLQDDLLVIHGTNDDVVLWQHSQAFIKSCIDSGVQVDYFIYPGHKHNVFGKDRLHLIKKMFEYIDERL